MTGITLTSEIKVELVQSVGGDDGIAAAACVMTPAAYADYRRDEPDKGTTEGLVNYLTLHRHGTPFEHSSLSFLVHAPIFVWREWHRHRIGMSYNEESGRYKRLEPVFYLPPRDRPMFKVEGWKPGRPKFVPAADRIDGPDAYARLVRNLRESYAASYACYEDNLSLGVDPGLARDCLPVGIYSSCWVTCNPRSLMHFLSLRTHEPSAAFVSYPLYEIEVAARQCERIFAEGWPLTYKAFVENGRVAP